MDRPVPEQQAGHPIRFGCVLVIRGTPWAARRKAIRIQSIQQCQDAPDNLFPAVPVLTHFNRMPQITVRIRISGGDCL
jgi:hypothetical protein